MSVLDRLVLRLQFLNTFLHGLLTILPSYFWATEMTAYILVVPVTVRKLLLDKFHLHLLVFIAYTTYLHQLNYRHDINRTFISVDSTDFRLGLRGEIT